VSLTPDYARWSLSRSSSRSRGGRPFRFIAVGPSRARIHVCAYVYAHVHARGPSHRRDSSKVSRGGIPRDVASEGAIKGRESVRGEKERERERKRKRRRRRVTRGIYTVNFVAPRSHGTGERRRVSSSSRRRRQDAATGSNERSATDMSEQIVQDKTACFGNEPCSL